MPEDKKRSTDEWQDSLDPERFQVCILGETERAFTGKYNSCKDPGTYLCGCCREPLFESGAKYESGSGWPSFFKPIREDAVTTHRDMSHGMVRVEVTCASCDAHLGHVFPDGPEPSGLRYCLNSIALDLELAGSE